MNQVQAILAHLKSGNTITSMQAYELYGCTRLNAKIFEIKKKGYDIRWTKRRTVNRFGNKSCFYEYYLVNEGDDNT